MARRRTARTSSETRRAAIERLTVVFNSASNCHRYGSQSANKHDSRAEAARLRHFADPDRSVVPVSGLSANELAHLRHGEQWVHAHRKELQRIAPGFTRKLENMYESLRLDEAQPKAARLRPSDQSQPSSSSPRSNRSVPLKADGTPDRRFASNRDVSSPVDLPARPLKADGTPNRRFTSNRSSTTATSPSGPLKADGTPDRRFASNRTDTPISAPSSGPCKADGTPDRRYASNRTADAATPSRASGGPRKPDSTPDMRYSSNRESSSYSSSYYCSSSSSSSSGPTCKDGSPDMRFKANW